MFKMSTWDILESTHYSKRVGSEAPGVVAVLLRLGTDALKSLWCMRPRTQKQPQVKKEFCRVLDNVK